MTMPGHCTRCGVLIGADDEQITVTWRHPVLKDLAGILGSRAAVRDTATFCSIQCAARELLDIGSPTR